MYRTNYVIEMLLILIEQGFTLVEGFALGHKKRSQIIT